tara:strand:+ start:2739 stop:2894 length:156 start_codon:yes stop_codon:yes gene_type:complete
VRKKLTTRQENALKKASKHHSSKHMALMRKLMMGGQNFRQAHSAATKKVGK